jgi:immune inhibitor A
MCLMFHPHRPDAPCFVTASPELREKLIAEVKKGRGRAKGVFLTERLGLAAQPRAIGFEDGVIIPPDEFPLGTAASRIRDAAAERAPLQGVVRVIVVLVEFSDKQLTETAQHFEELFFSTGVLPNGSVREYFHEASHGLVEIAGAVVGPYTMPQTLAWYANGNFGIGKPSGTTRARNMAHDAAVAADPDVDFKPYDNDGNGFVDAFIVVHAGAGGEQTGNSGDIWSHKWVLPSTYTSDATKIFAYLTIPEDAKIGVSAHELGHLLFGWPDLYDTDDTSEGIGNWCLMAGGSWNGGGDIPAHPSAWCKIGQGWVSVTNVSTDGPRSIPDVKTSHDVVRLWKDGTGGPEYFLVENRQRTGFDSNLPGDGLLIWHVDEGQPDNTNENQYKVGLVQADNKRNLELKQNRGDDGDPYPGSAQNQSFTPTSAPNSKSYVGQDTCVAVTNISASGATMTANVSVRCGKSPLKDLKDAPKEAKDRPKDFKDLPKDHKDRKDLKERPKDVKDAAKELKEGGKDVKELKEGRKDIKEFKEGGKDIKEFKEGGKDIKEFKEGGKDIKEGKERIEGPGGRFGEFAAGATSLEALASTIDELTTRVAAIEEMLAGGPSQAFIGPELRPDLIGGPQYGSPGAGLEQRMQLGDPAAKREFDSMPGA